jgi:CheY-like chemotaxis protein/HPt (histidine-containing phosphotransfer) domain-containing protein
MMPEMDGFTLIEQVRNEPGLAPPVIMMLTSADHQGDAARCRSLGLASYLIKPVKSKDLYDAIRGALERNSSAIASSRVSPQQARPTVKESATGSLRILLAEDNPVNQRLAVRILEKAGHSVTVAEDGRKALDALKSAPFDIVLMDVQMPELDGLEATRMIRAEETGSDRRLPIVAMTAHALKEDRERCLEAGMDDYVSKPIESAKLLAAIQNVLERSSRGTTAGPSNEDPPEPAFDLEQLRSRLDDDMELLLELVALYRANCPGQLAKLASAVAAGDSRGLHDAAHTLKGMLSNLCASPAAALAGELEAMARGGDCSRAPTMLAALEGEVRRLSSAFEPLS